MPAFAKQILVIVATVIITAVVTASAITLMKETPSASAQQADAITAPGRDDATALQLRALQDRLNRLENANADKAQGDLVNEAELKVRVSRDMRPRSEEELVRSRLDAIAQLDKALLSEPAGNAKMTPLVNDILASNFGDELGIDAPQSHESECRGRMCRVAARYADENDAADAATALNMEFGSLFPHTRAFVNPVQGGGYELVLFAATQDGRPLLSPPPSS